MEGAPKLDGLQRVEEAFECLASIRYRVGTAVANFEAAAAELALTAQAIPGGKTSSVPSSSSTPGTAIWYALARLLRALARLRKR